MAYQHRRRAIATIESYITPLYVLAVMLAGALANASLPILIVSV